MISKGRISPLRPLRDSSLRWFISTIFFCTFILFITLEHSVITSAIQDSLSCKLWFICLFSFPFLAQQFQYTPVYAVVALADILILPWST